MFTVEWFAEGVDQLTSLGLWWGSGSGRRWEAAVLALAVVFAVVERVMLSLGCVGGGG